MIIQRQPTIRHEKVAKSRPTSSEIHDANQS